MKYLVTLILIISFLSCSKKNSEVSIEVEETAGLDRDVEYIEVRWLSIDKPAKDQKFSLSSTDGLSEGQIQKVYEGKAGIFEVSAIFPVSIRANESKVFTVLPIASKLRSSLNVSGLGVDLLVENENFIADLTANTYTLDKPYSPGVVRALTLKKYNNQILKRHVNNMHWSPNFQGKGLEYRGLSDVISPDSIFCQIGPYQAILYKEGKVDGYEEIKLKAKYEFYAGLPYYIFSSEIYIERDVKLSLLRNDEMTMDSLFTHVIFKDKIHGIKEGPLYEADFFDVLEQDPIEHDASWLGFYHKDRNYGYGSIRLEYDNKNEDGQQSPLFKPQSKISKGSNGGRYWNRRLINEQDTFLPKGSRYIEKNAYFLFDSQNNSTKLIEDLFTKLNTPLTIKYL